MFVKRSEEKFKYLPCQSIGELSRDTGDMVSSMSFLSDNGMILNIDYQRMHVLQELIVIENLNGNLTIISKDAII